MHRIVKAYCDLLQDRAIPVPNFDTTLDVSSNPGCEKTPSQTLKVLEPAAQRHAEYFNSGWLTVVKGAWTHRTNMRNGPLRKTKALFMPDRVLDTLAKAAQSSNHRITKHDLILALIHEVCTPLSIPNAVPNILRPPSPVPTHTVLPLPQLNSPSL